MASRPVIAAPEQESPPPIRARTNNLEYWKPLILTAMPDEGPINDSSRFTTDAMSNDNTKVDDAVNQCADDVTFENSRDRVKHYVNVARTGSLERSVSNKETWTFTMGRRVKDLVRHSSLPVTGTDCDKCGKQGCRSENEPRDHRVSTEFPELEAMDYFDDVFAGDDDDGRFVDHIYENIDRQSGFAVRGGENVCSLVPGPSDIRDVTAGDCDEHDAGGLNNPVLHASSPHSRQRPTPKQRTSLTKNCKSITDENATRDVHASDNSTVVLPSRMRFRGKHERIRKIDIYEPRSTRSCGC